MEPARAAEYMAECMWSGVTESDLVAADARARASANATGGGSEKVRYLGSVLVPADEVVFFFFAIENVRLGAGRVGDRISSLAGRSTQPVDRALANEDPNRQPSMSIRPSLVAGIVLSHSDGFDRAARSWKRSAHDRPRRGERSADGLRAAELGPTPAGDLPASLGFAEEGYRIARTLGSQTAQAFNLAERCFVRATLGDVHGAREDAQDAQRFVEQVDYQLA